mmetsp:Transcript_101457/g.326050  ORF Transcript_101457/g.326050 Transcript_101457/m.326050 type:complete len:766 (+) Transcript_101457:213-2510(+)
MLAGQAILRGSVAQEFSPSVVALGSAALAVAETSLAFAPPCGGLSPATGYAARRAAAKLQLQQQVLQRKASAAAAAVAATAETPAAAATAAAPPVAPRGSVAQESHAGVAQVQQAISGGNVAPKGLQPVAADAASAPAPAASSVLWAVDATSCEVAEAAFGAGARANEALSPVATADHRTIWLEPFWAGGPSRILVWNDASTGLKVNFQAMLVEPLAEDGSRLEVQPPTQGLPLVAHFSGVGTSGGLIDVRHSNIRSLIKGPVVLVAPIRLGGMAWWVLTQGGDWGWVDGDLDIANVRLFANWLSDLARRPGVDPEWVSLLGYSAGAYAATEIYASGIAPVRSLLIGGAHGHGQPDLKNLDGRRARRAPEIAAKWQAYIERLLSAPGLRGGVFGSHHREDCICPWSHAEALFQALDARQRQLGFPPAVLQEVSISKAGKKKAARTEHNYSDQTFLRAEFWERLLPYGDHTTNGELANVLEQSIVTATASAGTSGPEEEQITWPPPSCDVYCDSVLLGAAVAWAAGASAAAHLTGASRQLWAAVWPAALEVRAAEDLFCAVRWDAHEGQPRRSRSRSRSLSRTVPELVLAQPLRPKPTPLGTARRTVALVAAGAAAGAAASSPGSSKLGAVPKVLGIQAAASRVAGAGGASAGGGDGSSDRGCRCGTGSGVSCDDRRGSDLARARVGRALLRLQSARSQWYTTPRWPGSGDGSSNIGCGGRAGASGGGLLVVAWRWVGSRRWPTIAAATRPRPRGGLLLRSCRQAL